MIEEVRRGGQKRRYLASYSRLLAASCLENGATLVTRNTRDFTRLRQVMNVRFMAPWPMAKMR